VVGKVLVNLRRDSHRSLAVKVTGTPTFNVSYTLTRLQWQRASVQSKAIRQNRNKNPWSQVRCVSRKLRVPCLLSRRSRVPRHTKARLVAQTNQNMTSPHPSKPPDRHPCRFQPVSRSTHAVCTSGTLHIVPLLLTAHSLLIKIPVLALPLSHDSDPLPAQTQVLGMEASQPYLSITCTPQQGAEKSKTCANDFFVYCYRMCFVPCCVQMYAVCFFSD